MSTTAKKTKPPTPWLISEAKELLAKDILAKKVDGMGPKAVFAMRKEYQQYEYKNFRSNLLALRKAIQLQHDLADADSAALAHDERIRPRANSKPYPRWDRSEAERLLKLDIDAGEHTKLKPSQLHKKRAEYQLFPPDVFRDHIYQEVRSRTESSYWWPKMNELREKKKKKGRRR
jgi:hypothetical protein